MKRVLSLVVIIGLFSGTVIPASAAENSQCAVGLNTNPYRAGYSSIIRDYGSPGTRTDLQFDGAICTSLIASGYWTGVSNRHEWDARNGGDFYPVCNVTWVGDQFGTVLTIWAPLYGRAIASDDCGFFDTQSDSRVNYFAPGAWKTS